jgi:adenylate cyclase
MKTVARVASYRFDEFVLDLVRGTLITINGEDVPLRHKSFCLLCVFVENAGRLLMRDAIIQAVWAGVAVSDDSITQCVRDVRLALGDEAKTTIKTIPRRGYIFTADVTPVCGADRPPHYSVLADKPSVVVLPFANMSGDPEQQCFSDGLTDDVINSLSRSRSLFVIAHNSSFTYNGRATDVKQIARELGVRYVVEGSVRRAGRRLRINAQLIDAETGNHIWADRYDRAGEDVFAIQDEITEALGIAINPAVSEAELRRSLHKPPDNLGAWETYQRGLWHLAKGNQASNEFAKEFFHRAIRIDANCAAAYSGLALAYKKEGDIYATISLDEAERLGEVWARKAVEIDSTDADGLAILAFCTPYASREEAYERISLALNTNPNSARAHGIKGTYLIFDGQPLEARDAFSTALRLNPRDPINANLGPFIAISYYFERDYARAVKAAKRAIAQQPEYPLTYRWLAAALGQLNRGDEAGDALRKAIEISPNSFEFYTRNLPPWMRPEDYAHMLEGLRNAGWQG